MRQYFIFEPYLWMQACFFQPAKFTRDFEPSMLVQRLAMMLRLVPLLFLFSYPTAIIARICIYSLHSDLYPYYALGMFTPFNPTLGWFIFDATWATALSCLVMALIGSVYSIRLGTAMALSLGIANGIVINTANDTLVGIVFGLAFGLLVGIAFNGASAVEHGGTRKDIIANTLGIAVGLVIGFFVGLFVGYWSAFGMSSIYPSLQDDTSILGSVIGLFAAGVSACLITFLLGATINRSIKDKDLAIASSVRVGVAVAVAFALALGVPVGDVGSNHYVFMSGVTAAISEEFVVGVGFLFCYLLSYYRLPLYPVSAYSMLQASLACQNGSQQALYCLRRSSLHWDECVFLPLPYLRGMLLLAAEQNLAELLQESAFILNERPQQQWAVLAAIYELVLRDLRSRSTLRDISLIHHNLAILLPPLVRERNATAARLFYLLDDISREAVSYQAQSEKRGRQEALRRIMSLLEKFRVRKVFRDGRLNSSFEEAVGRWKMVVKQAQETLGGISGNLSLDNPYVPGNPLEMRDPLFVGRDEIAQKLGQALQQKYRSTFLLSGERRMGKSSILKQLPILLGPRYIPTFYDLQSVSILSSAAAFFAAVITEVEKQLAERGIAVRSAQLSQFQEAQQQSQMQVYVLFEQWLAEKEQLLTREDRILILAFDEFEKLESAESRGTIDLNLLFDLFRNSIQNFSHIALLFSGAKMVGDMGRSWAGYFVNVERIKVSFLRSAEAQDLITSPVPQVFSQPAVAEIMRVTNCQPFLIQALCKSIIEHLNMTARSRASVGDVTASIALIFESWAGYFWDQWNRCDIDQRKSLLALSTLGRGTNATITQQTGISQQRTFLALEKLQMRDLILHEQDCYQIGVPIFAQWIAANYQHLSFSEE